MQSTDFVLGHRIFLEGIGAAAFVWPDTSSFIREFIVDVHAGCHAVEDPLIDRGYVRLDLDEVDVSDGVPM